MQLKAGEFYYHPHHQQFVKVIPRENGNKAFYYTQIDSLQDNIDIRGSFFGYLEVLQKPDEERLNIELKNILSNRLKKVLIEQYTKTI